MTLRGRTRARRAGVLLDAFVIAALLLLGAFALDQAGVTLYQILHGAENFFGR